MDRREVSVTTRRREQFLDEPEIKGYPHQCSEFSGGIAVDIRKLRNGAYDLRYLRVREWRHHQVAARNIRVLQRLSGLVFERWKQLLKCCRLLRIVDANAHDQTPMSTQGLFEPSDQAKNKAL